MSNGAVAAELWASAARAPYRLDFYQFARRIDCAFADRPRLGAALRPADEAVRFGQDAELDFAPAALMSFTRTQAIAQPRVGIRFFGLFGPNGPMPLHFTEFVRDRAYQRGDPALLAFADLFHHRLTLLFYRAWAQAQPAVSLDRRADSRFDAMVGALAGLGIPETTGRDAVPDAAKRYHVGTLARGCKNAEGLEAILRRELGVPVRLIQHVGHWLQLAPGDRSRVGARRRGSRLGVDAVAGARVWDRQFKFRVHLGPMTFGDYRRLLPGATLSRVLRDWVRQYVGFDLAWDVRLALNGSDVPHLRLGSTLGLGHATWLVAGAGTPVREDLVYSPEAAMRARVAEGQR